MKPNAIFSAVADRQRRLIEACRKGTFDRLPGLAARKYALPLGVNKLGLADPESGLVEDSLDDGDMKATFVVSTQNQDRDGDVVISRGCLPSLPRGFARNPVALFSHGAATLPIGLFESPEGELSLDVRKDRILGTCYFDKGSEFAREVFRLVSKKFMRTTSIGFLPLLAEKIKPSKANSSGPQFPGWIFKLWDLLEISLVGVPANPEALLIELQKGHYGAQTKALLKPYAATPGVWANGWDRSEQFLKESKGDEMNETNDDDGNPLFGQIVQSLDDIKRAIAEMRRELESLADGDARAELLQRDTWARVSQRLDEMATDLAKLSGSSDKSWNGDNDERIADKMNSILLKLTRFNITSMGRLHNRRQN